MADEIHVNDIGTEFRILILDKDAVVDLSFASELTIIFRKPNGSILSVTADLYTDGSDGIITYTSVDGDIDQSGIYKIQSYVAIGSSSYSSSIGSFKVHCNIN
mgnify:CR=1 FL=1